MKFMNCLTSKLIVYRNIDKESILFKLSEIFKDFKTNDYEDEEIINRIYTQINYFLLQLVMVLIRTYGIII